MLLYALAAPRHRGAVLLVVSLAFYSTLGHGGLLAALGASAAVTWGVGVRMGMLADRRQRRAWYVLGLLFNIGLLVGLKSWSGGLSFIGVSYFVFQAISYLSDVQLGLIGPEKSFWHVLLYFAFFPRVLQGPIEHAGSFIPQAKALGALNEKNVREGALRFAWGLFKKVVVADRCAALVLPIFERVAEQPGPMLAFGTYLFAIQLYFDFSGYSDMAVGAAKVFGVELTQNFEAPYLATSTADFWRRWHISFSTWIRDYLFEPLQMALRGWGPVANIIVLFMVFPLVGLWHGATFGYLAFGVLQAVYMSVGMLIRPVQKSAYRALGLDKSWLQRAWRIVLTFHMTCFALFLFRIGSWSDARSALGHLFDGWRTGALDRAVSSAGQDLWIVAAGVLIAMALYLLKKRIALLNQPAPLRWAAYYALALMILVLGNFFEARSFIYAQF
jgi:D-alanyl-lipoteichoic acid acyltransferase DltB (MBOAT superfamily)